MLTRGKRAKRAKRAGLLAAPIVMTAMATPACEGSAQREPRSPQDPPPTTTVAAPHPDNTVVPPGGPPGTAVPPEPKPPEAELEPIPADGGGRVERRPNGSCLYIFPPPKTTCQPTATCNPAPPRNPIKVKCPEPTSAQ